MQLYIQLVLVHSTKIDSGDVAGLLARIKSDWELMRNIFDVTTSKTRIMRNEKLVRFLTDALEVPFPKVMTKIINLKIFMKANFDANCVKCILRMRKDLEVEKRHAIVDTIKHETESIERLISAGVKPKRESIQKDGDERRRNKVDYLVKKFIYRTRLAISANKEKDDKRVDEELKPEKDAKGAKEEVKEEMHKIQEQGLEVHDSLEICCLAKDGINKVKRDSSKK